MEPIDCSQCGSAELIERSGRLVCAYCQTSFVIPASTVVLETTIGLDADIAELLLKCEKDPANRRRYAGLVLDLDPTNEQAERYLR